MAEIEQASHLVDNVMTAPAPGHGLYETRTVPVTRVGTKLELFDGRVFRMAKFAGDVTVSKLVSPDVSAVGAAEVDGELDAAAAGSKTITFDDAASAVNAFAGSFLYITDDAGEGYMYRIRSNTASDGTHVVLTLADPLIVAVTTASDVAIVGMPYQGLVIANAATDGQVSGTTVLSMDVSEAPYGWIQVSGIGMCLAAGTIAIEDMLVLAATVDGAVQTMDAYTEPFVGNALFAPDDTGYVGLRIMLE